MKLTAQALSLILLKSKVRRMCQAVAGYMFLIAIHVYSVGGVFQELNLMKFVTREATQNFNLKFSNTFAFQVQNARIFLERQRGHLPP